MLNPGSWPVRLLAVTLASFALTACGSHLGTSHVTPMSEAEADENIAARLEKTARVRKDLNELRDAFKKAEAVAKDLGFVLDRALGRNPGELVVQLVERLPEVFGSFSRSLVKTEVDGSWSLESPILAGLSLGDLTQCQSPRARITGKRVLDQEDVVLYLSDCDGGHWDRLAKWIVRPDGGIEMSYWPLVRANLRPVEGAAPNAPGLGVPAGGCQLTLSPGRKEARFTCSQYRSTSGNATSIILESLAIRDVAEGTAASISMALGSGTGVLVEFDPGRSPRITVCESEGNRCTTL